MFGHKWLRHTRVCRNSLTSVSKLKGNDRRSIHVPAPTKRGYGVGRAVEHLFRRTKYVHDTEMLDVVCTTTTFAIYTTMFISGITFFGIDATPFTVTFSMLGAVIGFSIQDVAQNYISGLMLLCNRVFKVGDIVTVIDVHAGSGRAKYTGRVMRIDLRHTHMLINEGEIKVSDAALAQVNGVYTNFGFKDGKPRYKKQGGHHRGGSIFHGDLVQHMGIGQRHGHKTKAEDVFIQLNENQTGYTFRNNDQDFYFCKNTTDVTFQNMIWTSMTSGLSPPPNITSMETVVYVPNHNFFHKSIEVHLDQENADFQLSKYPSFALQNSRWT